MSKRIRLGDITCPSGDLVVIDGGYLGIWSGTRSPASIDPALLGIDDPQTADDIRRAVDFEIVGPDAPEVSLFLAQQHPGQSFYDVPAASANAFAEAFETLCRDTGLDATLRAAARVPHRERARRTGAGGGFQAFGVPAVAVNGLPADRPLWVEAVAADDRDGAAAPESWWRSIEVRVSDAPVASTDMLGVVGVDLARLAFADADAISAWEHDDPIDGRADVVFWGRSQEEAAQAHDAPLLTTPGDAGTYGWADLTVDDAVGRARAVLSWAEADPARNLMVDFRPHSHHWRVMRQVRASSTSSGTVEVGGARILFAMTSRGDGVFPVHADRDATGSLVCVRVALDGSE